jgi:uncharacterized repeat protein (TIGR01451 family)
MRNRQTGCTRAVLTLATVLAGSAASAQLATVTTVDSGNVGQYTSVAYGTDGLPLISYYDSTGGDLKLARCLDVACASSTKQTLDAIADVGRETAIAIGADGFPIVAYLDATNARLKVAHCTNVPCTSWTVRTLDGVGPAGNELAVAIPPDGRPVVAVGDGGSVLRIARCVDVVCTDATATSHAGGGHNAALTIGGDGLPLFAQDQGWPNGGVVLEHCHDAACQEVGSVAPQPREPSDGTDGAFIYTIAHQPALATHPDGRAMMAWALQTITPLGSSFKISYGHCADLSCSSLTNLGSFSAGGIPNDTVVAIGANDRPTIAHTLYQAGYHLAVAPCSGATCVGVLPENIGTVGQGRFPSAAVSPAGRGLIAHYDEATGSLKATYLGGADTADVNPVLGSNPDPVPPLGLLTYGISTHNAGPDVARGLTATLALPLGVTFQPGNSSSSCTYDGSTHTVTCAAFDVFAGATVGSATVGVQLPPPGGLPGPLVATVTLSSGSTDPNLANNSASITTGTTHGILLTAPPEVKEGDAGLTEVRFQVSLLENGTPATGPVTMTYTTLDNSATAGSDYQPVSGSLTLTSAAPTQSVAVNVIGDVNPEPHEDFRLYLQNPQGAAIVHPIEFAPIHDDDVKGELVHGTVLTTDLRSTVPGLVPPTDTYWFTYPARASYEAVVDGVSGDLYPLTIERIDFFAGFALQSATAVQGSVSMRWEHWWYPDIADQGFRVRSGGCTTDCGLDDVYRIRVYETTARIARFNNSASQTTILLLQNPSDQLVNGHILVWSAPGVLVTPEVPFVLDPHASLVLNTSNVAPGASGSITITHDAPYGGLQGKAVALEPATGFSFDSPLEYRRP